MLSTLLSIIVVINELMASNAGTVISPATNFDSWIELYNPTEQAVNLDGMYLSNDADNLKLWQMPSDIGSIPAKGFKVIWLGSNDIKESQAPFKLDCDGGTICLSDKNGQLITDLTYPEAKSRTSYARITDGGELWGWTADATPEATNTTAVFASERLDAPKIDTDSKIFQGSLTVKVNIPEGTRLMYTTDGSLPGAPTNNPAEDPEGEEEPTPEWIEMLSNGNCEGDDASCFICRDGDGDGDVPRITDGVGYDNSRGVRVHAIANPQNAWSTQFFVYAHDYTLKAGDKFRFKMKARADKNANVSIQSHEKPGTYIHWQMLGNNYNITTQWQEFTYEGEITEQQAGKNGMAAIAFNLNEAAQENNFYFDDMSWELYYVEPKSPWTNWVKNSDCECDDVTCLVGKDGDRSGKLETNIIDGIGYENSRGIKVHAIANPENSWDTQFFVYTPDHIWNAGDKYRFRMKIRADVPCNIDAQAHRTPGSYIHWKMFQDGNTFNVTTEWQEFEREGTISNDQTGSTGGMWGDDPSPSELQTIAFNLNNLTGQPNNFYIDDVYWESFEDEGGEVSPADNSKESKDGIFALDKTTNLTVRLYKEGYLPSVPVTRSYIKTNNEYTLPVISIVGNKKFFTDPKIGFDCDGDGTNGKTGNGQDSPRNYNMDWDRPVNFSYIGTDGEMLFNQDVNISVSGGWTRSQRYRSFKLKANKIFDGQNHFDFQFFPQKPYDREKAILIRNGGNDVWLNNSRFVDPALETIIQRSGIDLEVQSYVPVIEYVNGDLRGVLNLREVNNDKFVYANWGYDDDEIDMFENFDMKQGNDSVIKRIFELGERINDEGAYEELTTLLDIDEYTNYMAMELYLLNSDWPNNNIKAYRSRHDGRYRFISFDLDYVFGRISSDIPDSPFDYITTHNQSMKFVKFFQNMMNHDTYRRKFIDTFCLMGGSVFEENSAFEIIDELLDNVQPMAQLMKQMGINDGHDNNRAADMLKNNLSGRASTMADYMKQAKILKLTNVNKQAVELKANTEGATITINGITVPHTYFNGYLFSSVKLEAIAPAGYKFKCWKKNGSQVSSRPVMSMPTGSSIKMEACFTPLSSEERTADGFVPVRINEVSASNEIYVNDYFKRNDWIELYNNTSEPVDVAGMYLTDRVEKPLKYQIAGAETVIPGHGHLIIWCDKLEPVSQLHAQFKLEAEGGTLMLTAADQSWSDRLTYTQHGSDQTVGRYPDGTNNVYVMNIPTIAKTNMATSYLTAVEQPEVPTAIDEVNMAAITRQQVLFFNLSGQPVATPQRGGCYIARITDSQGNTKTVKFIKK